MALKALLCWAKKNECYIEIFGNGNVEIQFSPDYVHTVYGQTLKDGLRKAKAELDRTKV